MAFMGLGYRAEVFMVLGVCLLALGTNVASAQTSPQVREEIGNIIFRQTDGTERQITKLHIDGQPVLSPDGRTIGFIRIEGKATVQGEPDFTALWIVDDSNGRTKRLIGANENDDPKLNLQSVQRPNFSFRLLHTGLTILLMSSDPMGM